MSKRTDLTDRSDGLIQAIYIMGLIAVDIVLLPSQDVHDLAVAQNRRLVAEGNSQIVLGPNEAIPHISLVMGCMDRRFVGKVEGIMQECIGQVATGPLTIMGIAIMTNRLGQRISSLLVQKTDWLQMLHEILLRQTEDIFSYRPQPSMIYGRGPVSQSTLDWIGSYRKQSSFHNFWPHITLGYGVASPIELPVCFEAQAIALCHLGDHCTCRKVLAEVQSGLTRGPQDPSADTC